MKTILNIHAERERERDRERGRERGNQMKRNTEMFCANKSFNNSFHTEPIQKEVLFF
jgi:hypothetical protein